ncbi:MAG: DUF1992 domain-containing protein [Caldilineaceae bacterium]|nr:DUF1992 domain-containing protein [Caldilineaceae bacterium]
MSQEKRNPSRLLFHRPPSKPDEERLRTAREQAADYRAPDDQAAGKHGVPTMDEWNNIVSQRIEEAMRRGEFDNLPGRGKPQRIQREPFVPEDQQMAFTLLQNNDLTPDWIGERKEVLRLKESFQEQVQSIASEALTRWHAAEDAAGRQDVLATWDRWLLRWETELGEINRRIQNLNLKQPIAHLEVIKLRLDDELRRAGVTRTLVG